METLTINIYSLGFLIIVALAFDFMNGFHDGANAISTIVATGALTPKQAVIFAAFFNFAALWVFQLHVAATIGKGTVAPQFVDHYVIFGALMGALAWNVITWYYGIPSSSSHALVGGLVGAALIKSGSFAPIIWSGFGKILLFIIISPLVGFLIAGLLMVLVAWVFRKKSPYQTAGFQWLSYLNDVSWGGILADDMGLGKTIQALTMLHYYKASTGNLKAIVICPTTLIYNWKNEVGKFTPELTWHIHHGSMRSRSAEDLQKSNIIITTYGTLRSDIQLLLKINFDYVVLDESQAIKNPSSKVTKAACLLNAKNRLCMSGTPLQNNTFDIFAQMNFLNPGLLGSMEFFRNEFATPIDKFGEPEQKDHLRKLLYPFILRRTKEQVAKDLPDKTETILFCEMEKEQRDIYEAYRDSYRSKILGEIDQQGIGKSQLTILQGLMKLRQICDSPAILNEEDKYPNHSIKLDELTREITENIGEHKALIFSQFLGMLALIRKKLTEDGIPFEYFDGSTSAVDREKAIQNFQNNDECRVFLISLKAGGVGLNLTAADYVYIVDPWWNPAVEQQAIDRTHRIGQTKNIFAYRMICIDTIEDKILQLQERKRKLASELIADDATFVKALSKADVEYLFS